MTAARASELPMSLRRHLPLALVLTLALGGLCLVPAHARAASGSAVIADCNAHSALTRHYTVEQLEAALRALPADVREYSDCEDVINRQLLAQEGKLKGSSPSGNTSGGSAIPTVVIVIVVVLLLAAATLGAMALRRRRAA